MDNISNKLALNILKKARQLRQLNQTIKASLPADCRDHIEVAGIRDSQLIILTDSPVWQTRLRLFSQTMLEVLHQHSGVKLNQVKLRLNPVKRPPPEEPRQQRVLSSESAVLIEQTATSVSDPGLQSALQRLSQKAKKP